MRLGPHDDVVNAQSDTVPDAYFLSVPLMCQFGRLRVCRQD